MHSSFYLQTSPDRFRCIWRPMGQLMNNLVRWDWLQPLPFQRFQALLALFPKSFSPFPHGTCSLSGSSPYSALDEVYHLFCAPVPRNATRFQETVCRNSLTTNGSLTLLGALSQRTSASTSTGVPDQDYNSEAGAPINILSRSLFTRHY